MEIPAARGAVHLAVLTLPWEKELKSHFQVTGCFLEQWSQKPGSLSSQSACAGNRALQS